MKIAPNAALYSFGVLSFTMHHTWIRYIAGRLESRYRYSASIVYNNFPWPDSPTQAQRERIEAAAKNVLDARAQFMHPTPSGRGAGGEGATLTDLYDPLTMPPALVRAHQKPDAAVDAAYGKKTFRNDAERVAFLFERYQAMISPLPANGKASRRGAKTARQNKPAE